MIFYIDVFLLGNNCVVLCVNTGCIVLLHGLAFSALILAAF